MRAMNTAVSGIRAMQTAMDVIANNIANVNTVGFKGQRTTFTDVFSELVATGGVTPQQIGLGAAVASVDRLFTPGSLQLTGRDLDFAVQGEGFFVTRGPNRSDFSYTRAGGFDWDASGYLINPATGDRVQGFIPGPDGKIPPGAVPTDIRMQRGSQVGATPSTKATLGGNLDLTSKTYQTGFTEYDSLGRPYSMLVNFTKTGDTTWQGKITPPAGVTVSNDTFDMTFGPDGLMTSPDPKDPAAMPQFSFTPTGANDVTVKLDLGAITSTYAGPGGSNVLVRNVDGAPGGSLESVRADTDGTLWGVYSNGERKPMAQIAIATFANPAGLQTVGNTAFVTTPVSGAASIGAPGTGDRGRLSPGNLEQSNVDLSAEFSRMILTQRGFQANTKVVSTADEMLQYVVDIRR